MIKEMALSTWNRHHFIEESKVSDWQNVPKDTFISLYDYDEHIREYFKEHKKLAGYDGLIYMPDEFFENKTPYKDFISFAILFFASSERFTLSVLM